MRKPVRISLANKCQLLFGAAVVLILAAALSIGWIRMHTLVIQGQQEAARKLADAWIEGLAEIPQPFDSTSNGPALPTDPATTDETARDMGLRMVLVNRDDFVVSPTDRPVLDDAIKLFETRDDLHEHFVETEDEQGRRIFAFARAIRKSDLTRIRDRLARQFGLAIESASDSTFVAGIDTTALADPLHQVLLIKYRADRATRQLTLNRIYIVASGFAAGLLAIGAFWYITTRIILSPVRVLRDTAEKIADGDTNIRSDINTGDEFEQLSDVFNVMLERLKDNAEELRRSNKSLDLKLGELAETNVTLYEANKVKGEFLANVSHELRTPLHSIIGFAEVLEETMRDQTTLDEKRRRYVSNIIISSRRLLDLINDLLDLAKIEAGRMEVRIAPLNLADTCEGLLNLIRPQAEKADITLQMKLQRNLPLVLTDAGKVQQVIFNFLSNAVKFTPRGGTVTLAAEAAEAPEGLSASHGGGPMVRISVTDTGPGIPIEMQDKIFEKFTQLDTSVTREHGGTGLGLTISRDLAKLLQGRIELDSDTGRGATFSLLLPLEYKSQGAPLMPQTAAR